MEPRLGGLRVLQSLEIDETDAEYQRKKQEAQQTLKNTFESIFARYSNVADDETDEVDLETGKIVVDNGHIRSMANDPKARERWRALGEIMEDDADSDSVDELAEPAMSPITIRRKAQNTEAGSPELQPLQDDTQSDVTPTTQIVPDAPPPTIDPTQLLSTLIQLPQISQQQALSRATVNPEHQNAFLMGLGQSVWQTITQSLTQTSLHSSGSAFGGILSSPAITPAPRPMEMLATDPKWQCPPLPERPVRTNLPQLSPPCASSLGKRRAPFANGHHRQEKMKRFQKGSLPVSATVPRRIRIEEQSVLDRDDLDPEVLAYPRHRTAGTEREYHLCDDDVKYIKAQRKDKNMTMEQVKGSRTAWKECPLHVFRQRYLRHTRNSSDLDDGCHFLESAPAMPQEGTVPQVQTPTTGSQKTQVSASPARASVKAPKKARRTRKQDAPLSDTHSFLDRHLPTPNSISNSENTDTEKDNRQAEPIDSYNTATEAQLDEDNSELCVTPVDEQPLVHSEETVVEKVPPEEIVLPSIETVDSQDQLVKPQGLIRYPRVEVRIPRVPFRAKPTSPDDIHPPSPRPPPVKCQLPIPDNTADSDSDIDLVPMGLPLEAEMTAAQVTNDGEQLDELAAPFTPFTPRVKRESVSPQPSSLFTIPRLSTPKSAPQLRRPDSSGSKSTSRLSKFHIARLARAQWAKQGHSGTPLRAKHRRSLGEALARRDKQEESDDELAK